MKWVELRGIHVNTDQMTAFFWRNGSLAIYHTDAKRVMMDDPDRHLYLKLCHQLGVRPAEEVADG